jgi:hypothetical protein
VAANPLQMPKMAIELGFSSPAAGRSVMPAVRVIVTEVSQLASDSTAAVNRSHLPGARRDGDFRGAYYCTSYLSKMSRSPTAAGSSGPAAISIVPVETAAPRVGASQVGGG